MILHNQDVDISENIKSLESHLHNLNFDYKAVHTGPIICREEIYKTMQMEESKRIFHALFNFARRLDFNYICTYVNKNECDDVIAMTAKEITQIGYICLLQVSIAFMAIQISVKNGFLKYPIRLWNERLRQEFAK